MVTELCRGLLRTILLITLVASAYEGSGSSLQITSDLRRPPWRKGYPRSKVQARSAYICPRLGQFMLLAARRLQLRNIAFTPHCSRLAWCRCLRRRSPPCHPQPWASAGISSSPRGALSPRAPGSSRRPRQHRQAAGRRNLLVCASKKFTERVSQEPSSISKVRSRRFTFVFPFSISGAGCYCIHIRGLLIRRLDRIISPGAVVLILPSWYFKNALRDHGRIGQSSCCLL